MGKRQQQIIVPSNGDWAPMDGGSRTGFVYCPFCGQPVSLISGKTTSWQGSDACPHAKGAVCAGGFDVAIHFDDAE